MNDLSEDKCEKGTIGWLRERQRIKAKKDGFDNIDDWLKWKSDPFNILEKKYGKDFADWARTNKNIVSKCFIEQGCRSNKEYRDNLAKRKGYNNYSDYQKHMYQDRGGVEYLNNLAQKRGYKNRDDLLDNLAKIAGFSNHIERSSEWCKNRYERGTNFVENKSCPQYLGIEIGERRVARKVLPLIVGNIIEEMPFGNSNFDFICKNENLKDKNNQDILKIDVKSAKLIDNKYKFRVAFNNIADYFLTIAFNRNDIDELFPVYIFLFGKSDMVRKKVGGNSYEIKPFCDREGISISNEYNSIMCIEYFKEYDKTYMIREKFSDLGKLMEL